MKVVLNALQGANQSGTGRYVSELAHALARLPEHGRGEFSLHLWWPQGIMPPPWARNVNLLPMAPAPLRRIPNEQLVLPRRFAGPDTVLHYPANFGPLWRGDARLVVTMHDCSFLRNPAWFRWNRALYYRAAAAVTAHGAARIIADSQAAAADIVGLLGFPRERIHAVPLGVGDAFRPTPEAAAATLRRDYLLPEAYLLYMGTLEPRKNLVRLVTAWDVAADDLPDLVLAGRGGWKCGPLQHAITQARHRERIHQIGYVEEGRLPALLSGATAFVWPSLFEGFGLPPLEAMACGVPVVTSNTSSLPEVVGDAAVMIDPTHISALAGAMRRVANDPAQREAMRQRGLQRVRDFTWARCARETLEVYRLALASDA